MITITCLIGVVVLPKPRWRCLAFAAVAPGISEALVNTAAGLAAAIPALVFYNYFMGKVRPQRAGMEDFALEFINLAERNFT